MNQYLAHDDDKDCQSLTKNIINNDKYCQRNSKNPIFLTKKEDISYEIDFVYLRIPKSLLNSGRGPRVTNQIATF